MSRLFAVVGVALAALALAVAAAAFTGTALPRCDVLPIRRIANSLLSHRRSSRPQTTASARTAPSGLVRPAVPKQTVLRGSVLTRMVLSMVSSSARQLAGMRANSHVRRGRP